MEYRVVKADYRREETVDPETLTSQLNALAGQGWTLVQFQMQVAGAGWMVVAVFSRP